MRYCFTLLLSLLMLSQATAAALATEKILHLGILALRPRPQMQQAWEPFANYLSAQLPGYRMQLHLLIWLTVASRNILPL